MKTFADVVDALPKNWRIELAVYESVGHRSHLIRVWDAQDMLIVFDKSIPGADLSWLIDQIQLFAA